MPDETINLKGNTDKLRYYRRVETGAIELRRRFVPGIENGEIETKLYQYPDHEKVYFDEHEVQKFSLDRYGEHIPYIDGDLTILNNYLFDYWGYYLNAEGIALYGHLKRHAYGNKDWCYPNLELISLKMGKSRPTLLNFINLLERYGFIYKFNVINESKENMEESPIYKIRKKVPLLTEKLINGDPTIEIPDSADPHIKKALQKEQKGLPPRLKAEHEKYIREKLQESESINIEEYINYEDIYNQWLEHGERRKTEKKNTHVKLMQFQAQKRENLSQLEKMQQKHLLARAETLLSKPSFDTWFRQILIEKNEKVYTLFAPNEYAMDWLKQKYYDLIEDSLRELDDEFESIEFKVISM